VGIAHRMKLNGQKTDAELVNNFISYVICENKDAKSLCDKGFTPEELQTQNLKIDVEWYATTQILPPITRLIEHIAGIEMDFVAQCLGIDPKKYTYHSAKGKDEEEEEKRPTFAAFMDASTFKSLLEKTVGFLSVTCPFCCEKYNFPGVFRNLDKIKDPKEGVSGLICQNKTCQKDLPAQYMLNLVHKYLKQLMLYYYQGKFLLLSSRRVRV